MGNSVALQITIDDPVNLFWSPCGGGGGGGHSSVGEALACRRPEFDPRTGQNMGLSLPPPVAKGVISWCLNLVSRRTRTRMWCRNSGLHSLESFSPQARKTHVANFSVICLRSVVCPGGRHKTPIDKPTYMWGFSSLGCLTMLIQLQSDYMYTHSQCNKVLSRAFDRLYSRLMSYTRNVRRSVANVRWMNDSCDYKMKANAGECSEVTWC